MEGLSGRIADADPGLASFCADAGAAGWEQGAGAEKWVQLERAVWEALKQGDAQQDASLLSDQFRGVYDSGIACKKEHVRQLRGGPVVAWYELSEPAVLRLADEAVMLSYRAHWMDTRNSVPQAITVSSIWRREQGAWRNVFSQTTESRS